MEGEMNLELNQDICMYDVWILDQGEMYIE